MSLRHPLLLTVLMSFALMLGAATPRQSASIGTYAWTVQGANNLNGPWIPIQTLYLTNAQCRISLTKVTNNSVAFLKSYNQVQFYRLTR